MVVDETIGLIRELYQEDLTQITVDVLIVGIFFTGVQLSTGHAGIAYTPVLEMHQEGGCIHVKGKPRESFRFKGAPVSEIFSMEANDLFIRTVQISTVNALSAGFLTDAHYRLVEDRDTLDLVDFDRLEKVAMVGAITPFLQRLKKEPNLKLHLIEKKSESVEDDEARFLVPVEAMPDVLSQCDTVIITGAAIANGTIESLLDLTREDATVIVAGPTAGFLPEALFARGVSMVSTVVVAEPERTLELLAEGKGAYQLFAEKCLRKINLLD
jgi:uncharacterized protein (DUF4213/DUF364 family)